MIGWAKIRVLAALGACLLLPVVLGALGTVSTWTGNAGTDDWGDASNWNLGVPDSTIISAGFNASNANNQWSITLQADRTVAGLTFSSTPSATTGFTFNSGNTLKIDKSGISNSDTYNTQTFNNAIALSATQTWTNNGTLVINGTVSLGSNALTVSGATNTITTISGVIDGSGSLTKTNSGTLVLSGANTYTGATNISAGTLQLGATNALSSSTAVTVGGGPFGGPSAVPTLDLNNFSTTVGSIAGTGSITLGSGALTTGANDTSTTFSGIVSGTGSVTKIGAGTLVLSGANTYTGTTTIGAGALNIQNNTALGSAIGGTTVASGAALQLQGGITVGSPFTGAEALTLNGTGVSSDGALRNISGNNTWTGAVNLGSASRINSDAGTLTISGNIGGSGQNLTVGGAGNTALSGIIVTDSGTLTKDGAGMLTLSGANTYTGATTISGGILSISADNNLGTAPGAPTASDLTLNGGTLQTTANMTLNSNRGVTLGASGGTLDVNPSATLTYGGIIAGSGSLTKTDSGTLVLSGANTYTGATNINAGILNIQSAGALGTASNTSNTTVANGAVLQMANNITTTNKGTLILNGSGTGSGALQNVSGNNTWNSAITLASDATIFSSTAGNTLNINTDYLVAYTLTMGNHTLTVDGPGDTWFNANVGVAGDTGGFVKNGTGKVTFYAYNTFYTGATTVNAGSLDLVVGPFTNAPGYYGINGALTIGTGLNPVGTVSVTMSNSYDNQISPTSAVTINSDGVLSVGSSTGLGSLTLNGGQISITSGKVLTPGVSITSNTNSAHRTSLISGGQVTLSSSPTTVSVARDSTLASDMTVSSVLAGTGSLTKTGAGILTFTGANTYTGATNINAGVLNIQNATALGTAAGGTTVASGAALQMQNNITVTGEALTLNGTGISDDGALRNVSGTNTWTGAVTLGSASRINSDAGILTLSGNIGGATQNLTVGGAGNTAISGVIGTTTGSLTKDGTGTLTLSGTNTYTGATNINKGILTVGVTNALSSSTAVTVASGATLNLNNYSDTIGSLAGDGVITLGSGTLTVGANNADTTFSGSFTGGNTGTFAKTGTGTLTFGAGMNLSAGTLVLNGGMLSLGNFTSTFGSLSVTADSILDFSASGSSILNILNSLTVNSGVTLTIKNWADTVDYFYSLTNPGATNLGRIVFTGFTGADTKWLSYDNQITPVPEPATYGAALLGLSILFAGWRLYRRRTA